MIGPRPAPKSVRFSEDVLKRVNAYARRRGVSEHAAILELVDRGLARARSEAS